jgi:hypothetical protein
VAAAEGSVHAGDAPDSSSLSIMALGTANPDFANLPGGRNRQRDWAILRGSKAGLEAHSILTELRESKLLGDELWSGVAVTERHTHIVAAISVVQDLMGLGMTRCTLCVHCLICPTDEHAKHAKDLPCVCVCTCMCV